MPAPTGGRLAAPAIIERGGTSLGIVGVTDHPPDFAAGRDRPGVAYADLRHGVPHWLIHGVAELRTDVVVATAHWGPNMVPAPVAHVSAAAADLRRAGATLVAGHSAHVFHGVDDAVLYDLGDFIDDYAVHPVLRNDRGLFFLATVDDGQVVRIEAVPLALDFCQTAPGRPGRGPVDRRSLPASLRSVRHRGRRAGRPPGHRATWLAFGPTREIGSSSTTTRVGEPRVAPARMTPLTEQYGSGTP